MNKNQARRRAIIYAIVSVNLLMLSLLIYTGVRHAPQSALSMRTFGLSLSAALGWLTGRVSASVIEIVMFVLPLAIIAWLVVSGMKKRILVALSGTLLIVSSAVALFFVLYFVNFAAPPLAQSLGLTVREYSVDELREVTEYLRDEVNKYAPSVDRSLDGTASLPDFHPLNDELKVSYRSLAKQYDRFDVPTLDILTVKKAVLWSAPMSYVGIVGFYCPWTAEPTVNATGVDFELPFDMAHELAHSLGIGPEDECNFTAYLVCSASDDVRLRYSGALNAYIYAHNALFSADQPVASDIYKTLDARAIADLRSLTLYLKQYETPVREAGTAVNDAFIKSTGQANGVRSYGKMVDLLTAWYFNR